MRSGSFEVLVNDYKGSPFPEEVIDDKVYVLSKPGMQYHVQVNVYKDALGKFPADHLRLGLFVDGCDVQYWKRLDFTEELTKEVGSHFVCSKFWGFKKNHEEINSFVFSQTSVMDELPEKLPTSSDERGRIKVVIYRAMIVDGIYENQSEVQSSHAQQQPVTTQEKFWKQPSLATVPGHIINSEKEKFVPLKRWVNTDAEPFQTLIIHYHTPSMIDLLKKINHNQDPVVPNDSHHFSTLGKRHFMSESNTEEENPLQKKEKVQNDLDVEVVIPTRYVPFLDMTNEDEAVSWDVRVIHK